MKNLFLVRGVPGCGKTTLAHEIADYVYSADDYFMVDGEYRFDGNQLGKAHSVCKEKTELAMQHNCSRIAVANTFTREWEMKEYFDLAEKYGYMVHSIIVENRHGGKNVHNVPEKSIENMKNRFEVKL